MEARKAVVGFLGRGNRKTPPRNNKSIVLTHLSRFVKKSISIAKTSTKPAINIIPSLIKKHPRLRKNNRRLIKLGRTDYHYNNYRFLEEYELSPPTTPLFRFKSGSSPSIIFFLCGCWPGRINGREDYDGDFTGLSSSMNLLQQLEPPMWDGEDDSVDRRAEWFIAKFYQEMRMEISQDEQD